MLLRDGKLPFVGTLPPNGELLLAGTLPLDRILRPVGTLPPAGTLPLAETLPPAKITRILPPVGTLFLDGLDSWVLGPAISPSSCDSSSVWLELCSCR